MKKAFKLYREGEDYQQVDPGALRAFLRRTAPLGTFAWKREAPGEHWVSISTPELTSICPFTDYPDFGSVSIEYVPRAKCLELKSFKLYINAFRNIKIFHEVVTEVIFADFLAAVSPRRARLTVDMNVRGNVKTVCRKYYEIPLDY